MTGLTKDESKALGGCLLTLYGVLVLGPAYLILMFAILMACDVPVWAWVLYWCYAPLYMLAFVLRLIVDNMAK